MFVLLFSAAQAATLKGTIYNDQLESEADVLIEVDTVPPQQFLAKNGQYQLTLPLGTYTLTAQKESLVVTEQLQIAQEGEFVFDIFLIPGLTEEEELWQESEPESLVDEQLLPAENRLLLYLGTGIVILIIIIIGRRWDSLAAWLRRRQHKEELIVQTLREEKKELPDETNAREQALDILKKHDGRMTQKELRKEMLPLSEAKVSLVVTELEHNNIIEKIKKGRGNVLIMKEK